MEASTKGAAGENAQRRNRHSEVTVRCPCVRAPATAATPLSLVNLGSLVNARRLGGSAMQQLLPWERQKFSPNRADSRAPRAAAGWAQTTGPDPFRSFATGCFREAAFTSELDPT